MINMDAIKGFLTTYGWQMSLVALAGIVIVGILKICKVFNCIKCYSKDENGNKVLNETLTKNIKKFIYYLLNWIFSIGSCSLYLLVILEVEFVWQEWLTLCGAVIAYSTMIYAIYENFGIRAIWQAFLNAVKKLFVKIFSAISSGHMTKEKAEEIAAGLTSETLNQLAKQAAAKEGTSLTSDLTSETPPQIKFKSGSRTKSTRGNE